MTLDFGEHMRISQQQRLLCACAWTKNCFLVWMTWKKKKKTLKNYTICPKSQCCVIMVNNHAWICKKESISKKKLFASMDRSSSTISYYFGTRSFRTLIMVHEIPPNKGIFVNIVLQNPEKQLFGKCYLNLHLFK